MNDWFHSPQGAEMMKKVAKEAVVKAAEMAEPLVSANQKMVVDAIQNNVEKQFTQTLTMVMNNPAILAPLALTLKNDMIDVNKPLLEYLNNANDQLLQVLNNIDASSSMNHEENKQMIDKIMLLSNGQEMTEMQLMEIKTLVQKTDFGKLLSNVGLNTGAITPETVGTITNLIQSYVYGKPAATRRMIEGFGGKRKGKRVTQRKK
jgi:hypothetical protein